MVFTFFREEMGTVLPTGYRRSTTIYGDQFGTGSKTNHTITDEAINGINTVPKFRKICTITNANNYGLTEASGIDPGSFSLEIAINLYEPNSIQINDLMKSDISDRAYIVTSIGIDSSSGIVTINGVGAINLLKRRLCSSRYMHNIMENLNPDCKYDALSLIDFAIQKECPTCYGNPPHMDMKYNKSGEPITSDTTDPDISEEAISNIINAGHGTKPQIFPISSYGIHGQRVGWKNQMGALPSPRSLLIDWRNPYYNFKYYQPPAGYKRLIYNEPLDMPFANARLQLQYSFKDADGNTCTGTYNVPRNNVPGTNEIYISDIYANASDSTESLRNFRLLNINSQQQLNNTNDTIRNPIFHTFNRGIRTQTNDMMEAWIIPNISDEALKIGDIYPDNDPTTIKYIFDNDGSFNNTYIGWIYKDGEAIYEGTSLSTTQCISTVRVDIEYTDGNGLHQWHKTRNPVNESDFDQYDRFCSIMSLGEFMGSFSLPHWDINNINYITITLEGRNGSKNINYSTGKMRMIVSSDNNVPKVTIPDYELPNDDAIYFPKINGESKADILMICDIDENIKSGELNAVWISIDQLSVDDGEQYSVNLLKYNDSYGEYNTNISGKIIKYPFSNYANSTDCIDYVEEILPNACDFSLDLSQCLLFSDNAVTDPVFYGTDTVNIIKLSKNDIFNRVDGSIIRGSNHIAHNYKTDYLWDENILHDRFYLKLKNDDGSACNLGYPYGTTLYDWINNLYNYLVLDSWKSKLNTGYLTNMIKPNIYMALSLDETTFINTSDEVEGFYTLKMIYDIPFSRLESTLFTDMSSNNVYNKVSYSLSNDQSYNVYMKQGTGYNFSINNAVDEFYDTFDRLSWRQNKHFENDIGMASSQDILYIPGYEYEIRSPMETMVLKDNPVSGELLYRDMTPEELGYKLEERMLPYRIKYRWWVKDPVDYNGNLSDPLLLLNISNGRSKLNSGSLKNVTIHKSGYTTISIPKNYLISMDKGMRWFNRFETTSEPTWIKNELQVTLETSKHFLQRCTKARYSGNSLNTPYNSGNNTLDYMWNLGDLFKLRDLNYGINNYVCKIISSSYISSAEGDTIDLQIETYKNLNNVYRDHEQNYSSADYACEDGMSMHNPMVFEDSDEVDRQSTIYNIQNW